MPGTMETKMKMILGNNRELLFQELWVFTTLKSIANRGDHFEVTVWVPVTISTPNLTVRLWCTFHC
jgi:hypothetical protein